jgi:hypothetical protein
VCICAQLTISNTTSATSADGGGTIAYVRETIFLISVSAILESPAEYFYCDALVSKSMQSRVVAEGVALAVKSASIYGALLLGF